MDLKGKDFSVRIVITLSLASVIGFAVSLLIAGIGAYLIEAETLGVQAESGIVGVALLLGSSTAAIITVKREQGTRIILCLTGAVCYYLVLLCCGALVFDGIRSGIGMTALVVLCGALAVWLLGMKREKKAKYRLPKF